MQCVLVTGAQADIEDLAHRAGVSLARASAAQEDDGRWSVIAYVEDDVPVGLTADGYSVVVLQDSDALNAQWTTVLGQVEQGGNV